MSSYDKAVRKGLNLIGSTGETLGPGSYEVERPPASRVRSDGYAPFLSMTIRDTHTNLQDTAIAVPGPGQYDPHYVADPVKGGTTLQNRTRRFVKPDYNFTPGPGAYNVGKLDIDTKPKTTSKQSRAQTEEPRPRIVIARKPDAPSIPTPGQAYGFEENEDGTLRRQEPPEKDDTIGPAFYSSMNKYEGKVTKMYKGNNWSKMKGGRSKFGAKEGPGPGEYEPYTPTKEVPQSAENINLLKELEKRKFEAKLPRYHEWVVKEEERKGVPGPGKYEVQSTFDQLAAASVVNQDGIEIEHPPFGTQTKRFSSDKKIAPPPGQYNDPRTALESLKRTTGLKRSPFGQTAVRFGGSSQSARGQPGPGSYNIPGMGTDSMKKAYVESTRRGIFGTTSARIQQQLNKDDYGLPGPAHYQVKTAEKAYEPKYKQPTSVFSSLTNRLPEDVEKIVVPPPGSYNVHKSYASSQDKHASAAPRNDTARRRAESFQSSSARFAPPRDVVIHKADPINPGPGTYDPKLSAIQETGGLMVVKDARFRPVLKNDVPGPNQYEFSPLIRDTVLKGTFNSKLNNPVTSRIQGTQPMKTQQAFLFGV